MDKQQSIQLNIGDAFTIADTIYNGKSFRVVRVRRDDFTADQLYDCEVAGMTDFSPWTFAAVYLEHYADHGKLEVFRPARFGVQPMSLPETTFQSLTREELEALEKSNPDEFHQRLELFADGDYILNKDSIEDVIEKMLDAAARGTSRFGLEAMKAEVTA